MFTSLVSQWKARVLEPRVATKMDEVGKAWADEARRLAPVDTGKLRSQIGYSYDASTKRLILFCDSRYALFQELGTRHQAAHPFMRPALSVVPRVWRGSIGNALTGHSVELQSANLAPKYHAKTVAFAKGKTRGARLIVGHGRFG